MTAGHVSLAIRANGQQGRTLVPGTNEDRAVPINRSRHDRVALAVAHAPDFSARGRVISANRSRAGAYDLFLVVHGDKQRCAEGELLVTIDLPLCFPKHFSRGSIQSDDEGMLRA